MSGQYVPVADESIRERHAMIPSGAVVTSRRLVLSPCLVCVCVAGALLGPLSSVRAHPLGDDSITHISVLWLYRDRVDVELFLDIAEIPSMDVLLEMDTNRDGEDARDEQEAWLTQAVERHRTLLHVSINERPIALQIAKEIPTPDGAPGPPYLMLKDEGNAPGLWTFKILARYTAPLPGDVGDAAVRLRYEDATYPDVRGLKRVLIERPDEVSVESADVKFVDEGDPFAYEQYDPFDMPQERTADVTYTIIAPSVPEQDDGAAPSTAPSATIAGRAIEDVPAAPGPAREARQTADRIIEQVRGGLTPAILLVVSGLCFVYGAWHALMPGHAKTVVAAYLISQHGRPRHAVVLALVVTATHTAVVYVMMTVIARLGGAKGSSLQLALGAVSGGIILLMGLWLGFRAATGRLGEHHHHHHDADAPWWKKLLTHSHPEVPGHHHHHDDHHHHDHVHSHEHSHTHDHAHDHSHDHDHHHHHHHHHHEHHHHDDDAVADSHPRAGGGRITARQIILLGISGGIVPCPTATFLGLGLVSYNVVLAFYLVTVFSVGLALTLMMVGFAALLSNRFAGRVLRDAEHSHGGGRWMNQILPGLSSVAVVVIGSVMVAHYVYQLQTGRALVTWLG